MNQRPFVVLDRDGTIIVEQHYLSDPRQVELLPGAGRALRQLGGLGCGLVVITNQSAVGRGWLDQERLGLIHERLTELLALEGVKLHGIYVCPHTPQADCPCRKPRPELLARAAKELDFDPRDSFVIGDKASDIELGQTMGAKTFLVRTGYGVQMAMDPLLKPDYTVDDLWEAAQIIQHLLVGAPCGLRLNPNSQ